MSVPMIEVKHLKKYFDTPRGVLHAVDDISFKIEKGKTMGVVGESGCENPPWAAPSSTCSRAPTGRSS